MGPLMYRHRPSYPALVAAICVIMLGTGTSYCLKKRVEYGEGSSSSIALVACLTVAIAGAFIILAFARYKFTHLKTDRAFAKKNRKNSRGR